MIRILKYEELSSTIEETAQLFFKESQLPGPPNFAYWIQRWKVLYDQDLGCVFSFEVDGKNRGVLGGLFVDCMMTGQKEAIEALWYVQRPFRGGVGGIRLIKAFEAEAIRRGCKRIKMAYLMSVNPELMDELYKRMGYKELQRDFVKEL